MYVGCDQLINTFELIICTEVVVITLGADPQRTASELLYCEYPNTLVTEILKVYV